MFPKGLLFAIILGVVSGPIFGIILYEYGVEDQLIYVDGTSLSIVTEKTNFTLGEPISITIVNSGTDELKFPDASYGLIIKQLDSGEHLHLGPLRHYLYLYGWEKYYLGLNYLKIYSLDYLLGCKNYLEV